MVSLLGHRAVENHAISVESNSSGRLRRKEQLWHNSLLKETPRRIPYETFDRIVLNISRRKKETKLISSSLTSRAVSSDLSPGFLLQHLSRIKKRKKRGARERDRGRQKVSEGSRSLRIITKIARSPLSPVEAPRRHSPSLHIV